MADAGDGAAEVVVGLGEAQPVEERDRPRAHRHDVAENPADAGRGALERLDRGGMVVRLDLERDGLALAEVDHAGVLAGALQDALALRRKPPQQEGGVLVAAVLRPEQREDGELEVVRVAAEQLADAVELLVGQPQRTVERLFRRDLRQEQESTRGRRRVPATFLSVVISVRRARPDDVDFLVELVNHDDVQPFLGGRAAQGQRCDRSRDRTIPGGSHVVRPLRHRGGRRSCGRDGVRGGKPPFADRSPRASGSPSGLPRATRVRRGGARVAAPSHSGSRLPPSPARDLRVQRAGAATRRARRLPARGRAATGLLASRRLGRRCAVRARAR